MKKLVARLKTKSFWVSILSALILIASRFVPSSESGIAENAVGALASIALLFGITVLPATGDGDESKRDFPPEDGDENK